MLKTKIVGKKVSKIQGRAATIAMALILLLAISCLFATMPAATAEKRATFACISTVPKTTGQDQMVLINGWITPPPDLDSNANPIIYHDIMVYITKPDGNVDIKGPIDSDGPGTIWLTYTPDMLGTYSVVLKWAGSDIREAVESPPTEFTVQSEAVPPAFEPVPLPTDYWTRPINAENRAWSQIAGDWLSASWCQYDASDSCFNPYSEAPSSAHILWDKKVSISGLSGGQLGDLYYGGGAEPVIVAGRAIYVSEGSIHCVDVKTGEEYWATTGGGSLIAQPVSGGTPLIWAISGGANITARVYNAYTGILTRTLTGPGIGSSIYAGLEVISPNEMYIYICNHNGVDVTDTYKLNIMKSGTTLEAITEWKTTVPLLDHFPTVADGTVVLQWQSPYLYALDAETGKLKWNVTQPVQAEMRGSVGYGLTFQPYADRTIKAYDLQTGAFKWETEPADYPWGQFWSYAIGVAYDKIYTTSYDGHIYCFDASNGSTVWDYYVGDTTETPYGTWPFYGKPAIADGKVYAGTTEHTPTNPYLRGFRLYAFNAYDGTPLWSIAGSYGSSSIADGVLVTSNGYDGKMYAFAKGQTATTVAVAPEVIQNGSSVLIKGTVMDLSPAQPNTPAVSADSMTGWMEYLHMQKPKPTNTTGVTVTLTATDQNGNKFNIGTATSDASGLYSVMWTPPTESKYTITASFEGSESYYASSAETVVGVTAASSSSVSPSTISSPSAASPGASVSPSNSAAVSPSTVESQAPASTGTSSTTMYIAIAAVVVIVAVVAAALVLKKRRK
jgi:outer membrane protein assembly factor BamB